MGKLEYLQTYQVNQNLDLQNSTTHPGTLNSLQKAYHRLFTAATGSKPIPRTVPKELLGEWMPYLLSSHLLPEGLLALVKGYLHGGSPEKSRRPQRKPEEVSGDSAPDSGDSALSLDDWDSCLLGLLTRDEESDQSLEHVHTDPEHA